MKEKKLNSIIFIFIIVILILKFFYYYIIPKLHTDDYVLLEKYAGISEVDTFLQRNLGFGVYISNDEAKKMKITCDQNKTPKILLQEDKNILGDIVCVGNISDFKIAIGWINISNQKKGYDYLKKIIKSTLDIKDVITYTCVENNNLNISFKMPRIIYNCFFVRNNKTEYYSSLLLYPSKIKSIVPVVVVYNASQKSNHYFENFISKIIYISQ